MDKIHFFTEDVDLVLPNEHTTAAWLEAAIQREGYVLDELNIVLGSDEFLHAYNMTYLQHDTWTDIITFDYSDVSGRVEGELYVSVERIRENAQMLTVPFWQELHTVLVHGVLHLVGYKDDTPTAKAQMRQKEAEHIAHLPPSAYPPA